MKNYYIFKILRKEGYTPTEAIWEMRKEHYFLVPFTTDNGRKAEYLAFEEDNYIEQMFIDKSTPCVDCKTGNIFYVGCYL